MSGPLEPREGPALGTSDALKAVLLSFSEDSGIRSRAALLSWQSAALSNISAVSKLIQTAGPSPTLPLGVRQAALAGATCTLLSAVCIMALLDVDAVDAAGQSGSLRALDRYVLVDTKFPKGLHVDPEAIRYAAAAAGSCVVDRLPVMARTCCALAELVGSTSCDPRLRRRMLPEVIVGLLQCQNWLSRGADLGHLASASCSGGDDREGGVGSARSDPSQQLSWLLTAAPARLVAGALLSVTSGQVLVPYARVGAAFGLKAAVAAAQRGSTSGAREGDSASGGGADAGDAPPALPPRSIVSAASALLCQLIVTRRGRASPLSPTDSPTAAAGVSTAISGVEALCDAVCDAADMGDPLVADRARGTVAHILASPPLQLVSPAAYLAAVTPQLLRLLHLRGQGAPWLHSVAALTLSQLLASRQMLVPAGGVARTHATAQLHASSSGSDRHGSAEGAGAVRSLDSLLYASAEMAPVPPPPAYRPLHLLMQGVVAPLLRPLLLFAVGSRTPAGGGDPFAAYLRHMCLRAPPATDGCSRTEGTLGQEGALLVLADEDEVTGSVELLHAVMTQGQPLAGRLSLRLLCPAAPALFTLYALARSNRLRTGAATACREVLGRLLAALPSQAAAVAVLLRAAAGAAATLPTLADPAARQGLTGDLLGTAAAFHAWFTEELLPPLAAAPRAAGAAAGSARSAAASVAPGAALPGDPYREAAPLLFAFPTPVPGPSGPASPRFELGPGAGYQLVADAAGRPGAAQAPLPVLTPLVSAALSQRQVAADALCAAVVEVLEEAARHAPRGGGGAGAAPAHTGSGDAPSWLQAERPSAAALLTAHLLQAYGAARTASIQRALAGPPAKQGMSAGRAAGRRLIGGVDPEEGRVEGEGAEDDSAGDVAGSALHTGLLLRLLDRLKPQLLAASSLALQAVRSVLHMTVAALGLPLPDPGRVGLGDVHGSGSEAAAALRIHTQACARFPQAVAAGSTDEPVLLAEALPASAAAAAAAPAASSAAVAGVRRPLITVLESWPSHPPEGECLGDGPSTHTSAAAAAATAATEATATQATWLLAVGRAVATAAAGDAAQRPRPAVPTGSPPSAASGRRVAPPPVPLAARLSPQQRADTEEVLVLSLSLLTAAAVALLTGTDGGEEGAAAAAASPSLPSDLAALAPTPAVSMHIWTLLRSCLPLLAALAQYPGAGAEAEPAWAGGPGAGTGLARLLGGGGDSAGRSGLLLEPSRVGWEGESEGGLEGGEGAGLRGREVAEMAASLQALALTLPRPALPQAATETDAAAQPPGGATAPLAHSVDVGGRRLPFPAAVAEAVQLIAVRAEPALQAAGCRLIGRIVLQAVRAGPTAMRDVFGDVAEAIPLPAAETETGVAAPATARLWADAAELGAQGASLLGLLLQQLAHPDAAVNLAAADALSALAAVRPAAMLPPLLQLFAPEAYAELAPARSPASTRDHVPRGTAAAAAAAAPSAGFYLGRPLQEVLADGALPAGAGAAAASGRLSPRPLAAAAQQPGLLPARLRARVGEALALAVRRLSGGVLLAEWAPLCLHLCLQVGARGWKATEAASLRLLRASLHAAGSNDRRVAPPAGESDGDEEDAEGAGEEHRTGAGAAASSPGEHPYNMALLLVDWTDLRASALACAADVLAALGGPAASLTGSDTGPRVLTAPAAAAAVLLGRSNASAPGSASTLLDLVTALQGVLAFETAPLEAAPVRRLLLLTAAEGRSTSTFDASLVPDVAVQARRPGGDAAATVAMDAQPVASAVPADVAQLITACAARVRRSAAAALRRLLHLLVALPASATHAATSTGAVVTGAAAGLLSVTARAGRHAAGERSALSLASSPAVAEGVRACYAALQRAASADSDAAVRQHALDGLAAVDEAVRGSLGLTQAQAATGSRSWIKAPT